MRLPIYQVDAFVVPGRPFSGNPAAVCPLDGDRWPDDALLLGIAAENNLSETAFLLPARDGVIPLRWFTPAVEVDLCGHATLASAFVLFERLGAGGDRLRFSSRSGELAVARRADLLELDFPARRAAPCPVPDDLVRGLGTAPEALLAAVDYLAVLPDEESVRSLTPDFAALARLPLRAVIVTAPGREVDFVSRFFAPRVGVPEDPVTGSAHTTLIPYWSARLDRRRLRARQLSRRGGELECEDRGDRVSIAGRAILYLEGQLQV